MRRFYLFIFAACLLIAAYPGREFVIRPHNVTILSWMRDQTITVVPVADFKPPVVEPIDPAKVRDLKHETGGIFPTQLNPFGFPRYGLAIYTFRYPYRGEMNWYGLEVKYRCGRGRAGFLDNRKSSLSWGRSMKADWPHFGKSAICPN